MNDDLKLKNMEQRNAVTICVCTSRIFIDKDKVAEIAATLRKENVVVNIIPDLCDEAARVSERIEDYSSTTILACYPRAVQSLFRRLGLEAENIVDIRNASCQAVLEQLQLHSVCNDTTAIDEVRCEINGLPAGQGNDAWYPVIDKERCTECGKCSDFCLFGVYSRKEGKVTVSQPQNCKNNCPACARICPGKAIIFPKYAQSPINGGMDEEEKSYTPQEMERLYSERLKMRLQQRKPGISLIKNDWS